MLKKLVLTISAIILLVNAQFASPKDTLKSFYDETEEQHILNALDSLTYLLYTSNSFYFDTTGFSSFDFKADDIPVFPDSVYAYRLSLLDSPMEFTYNEYVRRYIDVYVVKKREQVQKMLGLAQMYFPLFEEILDKHGLPLELKYLPIIESALNPMAVSRAGATGLWQFMYPTGKMYSLNINSYIDDRRDPYLATEAAAIYLKDLFNMYNDWALALAAYNYGPGNINKAIRRSGGKTSYWELRDYLPAETRGYVPAFIAAAYAMNYYKEHNLIPIVSGIYTDPVDTVKIDESITLAEISHYINVPVEELKFLNPNLKTDKIPYIKDGYGLRLPMTAITTFIEAKDSIFYASKAPVVPTDQEAVYTSATKDVDQNANISTAANNNISSAPAKTGNTKLIYTVKAGDNLSFIAEWYDCNVSEIKSWNGLRSSRLNIGQKIAIYVPANEMDNFKNIDKLSFDQKQTVMAGKSGSTAKSSSGNVEEKYIQYTIRSGDSLWSISRKYPKNTVEDIKKMNDLTSKDVIKPGMKIKVVI